MIGLMAFVGLTCLTLEALLEGRPVRALHFPSTLLYRRIRGPR